MKQIPAHIDHQAIIKDLNALGHKDYSIEMLCGYSIGYVAQLKCGNIQRMSYDRAARLYNIWVEETNPVTCETLQIQTIVPAST